MPILYLNFKGFNCAGCLTSIENCLYRLGIEHFDYDLSSSQAKIIYKRDEITQEKILKCIKDLGYEPYVSVVIEDEEYA